jgi:sulfate transport system substrate-binding protein
MKKITQLAVFAAIAGATGLQAANQAILNVSYDPTRELYSDINKAFAKQWAAKTGDSIAIDQSHGGSGKQSRSIVDGLEADVATLALAYDIDAISDQAGLLPKNWQTRLPQNSSPYTSTIVFVVRKGNPKAVKDWNDLTRDGVKVITPNPKTSGGARWNYLAAYAYALRQNGGDEQKARGFVSKLYSNVPVLDTGARGSTITFTERRMGDVFLSWENEAHLIQKQYPGQYEIITPSLSILAEPPVALVDKVVDRKGTREVAQAYLEFLYTPEAQDIIGRHYYRPRDASAAAKYSAKFPKIDLVTIEDFGGWRKAQKDHFNDGGIFDRIYKPYRP